MTPETSEPSAPKRLLRTVSPAPLGRRDGEMNSIGFVIGAVLLVVLLPVLPFLFVAWMISRTLRGVRNRVSWE